MRQELTSSSTMWQLSLLVQYGLSGRANARERHGREFKSHQVRRFSYGSSHSADNAASLTHTFNENLPFDGKKNTKSRGGTLLLLLYSNKIENLS